MRNQRSMIAVLGISSLLFGADIASAQVDVDAARRLPGELGSAAGGVGASARGIGDAEVGVHVQSELSRDLQMPRVRSDVRNGVATLNGTVASEADKQRAEQIARRVEGVTRVRNALVVEGRPSAGASVGSSAGASVGERLEQRTRSVGPSTNEAIASRLRADARLTQRDIDVRTRGDVITLTGEVQSVAEKEAAGRIAAETATGTEVRNRLNVRTKD
jgi:osmotically-inducible protein OsmY